MARPLMIDRRTNRSPTPLTAARRVVVKVGSALLVDARTGRLNRSWLKALIGDLLRLHRRGQQVILVSSGAIALGRRHLGLGPGVLRLEESQAAAAVGQIRLAHAYKELLEAGDVTVATAEIRYGDNDRLAARVAQMASADCLVLLSDIDGLYTADPHRDPGAQFIGRVMRVTPEIEAMAGRSSSEVGSGGMATKIAAARIAVNAGCHMCIASGHRRRPLRRLESCACCSWFMPASTPLAARKQWIAGTLRPAGAIYIDSGARRALEGGKSLL